VVSASVAIMCVRTYHVRNNYVTYIVAMRPSFRQFKRLLCVAAMSTVYHSYDFEMDTEKQRQRRRDDARLTGAETPEASS